MEKGRSIFALHANLETGIWKEIFTTGRHLYRSNHSLNQICSCYDCHLIAQNGDSKKEEIAFAQSYAVI